MNEMKASTLLQIVGVAILATAVFVFISTIPEMRRYLRVRSMM